MATGQGEKQEQVFGSEPAVAKAGPAAPVDLSAEIAAAVEREPRDRVRCTWISGHNYRCNWWAPETTGSYDNPAMVGLTVTTHRVRQSKFLSVTKVGDRLVIDDRSPRRTVGYKG